MLFLVVSSASRKSQLRTSAPRRAASQGILSPQRDRPSSRHRSATSARDSPCFVSAPWVLPSLSRQQLTAACAGACSAHPWRAGTAASSASGTTRSCSFPEMLACYPFQKLGSGNAARKTARGRQLTLCSAAMTSTTLPPSPQRPLSQRHEPDPCGSGMRYSSTGRSLTRTCCCMRSLSSLTSERSVSSNFETVCVNAASVLGSASESEISDERVPAWGG